MRTALITGAGGGIGQALIDVFVDAGYEVIATDKIEQPAALAHVVYHRIDLGQLVCDGDYGRAEITDVRKCFAAQGLNVLINNAAIQMLGGVESLTLDDWRRSLDVNLLAPFLLTQGLMPELERAAGCVINISSIHSRLTKKGFVAYATTKAALSGLTRAMAIDLGQRVRINAIEPAAIGTDMLAAGFARRPDLYQELLAAHPQGRIGTPQEVAEVALAIAGNRFRFLHGACITLDGGISARLHDPD